MLAITVIIMNLVPIITWIFARILYPNKYIVDNNYLIKYRRKQIVFKIKIDDIKCIYIKRMRISSFFSFIYEAICGPFKKAHGTSISIAYKNHEIKEHEILELPRESLITDNCEELFQHCEILSYGKCIKLCKKIHMTPILI
jgi:hypothetical protein